MVTAYYLKNISPCGHYLLQAEDGLVEEVVTLSDIYQGLRIVKTIDPADWFPYIVPWFIHLTAEYDKPCRFRTLGAAKAAITRYIKKRGAICR